MKRIRVLTRCVADRYANQQHERIIEFSDPETGNGGLISFIRLNGGKLRVDVYRCDPGVIVTRESRRARNAR